MEPPELAQVPLKIRHPLRPLDKIEVQKRCPKCGSVFITERECESCSYQFWVDLLGVPFGERSFFEIKSDYDAARGLPGRLLPRRWHFTRAKHRRYLSHLRRRFGLLLDYFSRERGQKNREEEKFFFLEAELLIETYILEGGEAHLLPHFSSETLESALEKATIKREEMESISWRDFLGQNTFPVKVFLLCVVIMLLALAFYAYLTAGGFLEEAM